MSSSRIQACMTSLIQFEISFHKEVFKWIEWKMTLGNRLATRDIDILDLSYDNCVFSYLLKTAMKARSLTTAVRGDQSTALIDSSIVIKKVRSLNRSAREDLLNLGLFDLIVMVDIAHETEDMSNLLTIVKCLLRNDDSRIIMLMRPKNPPPPMPDVAVPHWRSMAPKREDIIKAIIRASMGQVCYAISCPVDVSKQDWLNILQLRTYHALRSCPRFNVRELREFASTIKSRVVFEEKLVIFMVTPKIEQGDSFDFESWRRKSLLNNQQEEPESPPLLNVMTASNLLPPTLSPKSTARRGSCPAIVVSTAGPSGLQLESLRQKAALASKSKLLSPVGSIENDSPEASDNDGA